MNSIVSRVASGWVLNRHSAHSGCGEASAVVKTSKPASAIRLNTSRNRSSIVRK
jgi:hypothetical protein